MDEDEKNRLDSTIENVSSTHNLSTKFDYDIRENISIVDNFAYAVNDEMQVKETRVGDISCLVIDDYFADPIM